MNKMISAAAVALWLCAGQGAAQDAQPTSSPAIAALPGGQNVHGIVAELGDKSLTLTQDDGTRLSVDLLPNASVMVVAPALLDDIQAGGQVRVISKTQPDGTSLAMSITILAPGGMHHPSDRTMGDHGLVSTNGTVTAIAPIDHGRSLTVDYGSGTRKISVTGYARITTNTPATRDQIRPGTKVFVTTRQAASASRGPQQFIQITTGGL
jgi:hypothetical protein